MKRLFTFSFLLALVASMSLGSVTSRPVSAATADLLMLGSTLYCGGCSYAPEVQEAIADGLTYNVVSDATWASMTSADFASYKAIVLGDPDCATSPPTAAAANASTWATALTGDILIAGTDPTFHTLGGNTGARTLIRDALNFAASQPGKTGAYIALSCYYAFNAPNTPVPMLSGLGKFQVQGQDYSGSGCPNNSHIVASSPALLGLADADLSNWGCSTHEVFNSWDPSFSVLAIQEDDQTGYVATDGTSGGAYILARGPSLSVISNIDLNPMTVTQTVGTNQTLTATVTENGSPAPGKNVTFTVLPGSANAGMTGTGNTDSSGKTTFTYTSTTPGTDFIHAQYTDSAGHLETSGNAEITWVAPSNKAPVVNVTDMTLNEGMAFSENGTFNDPDSTSWTATVDYGDGTGTSPLSLTTTASSGGSFALNHTYAAPGTYTVTITVTDNQGQAGAGTSTVVIKNLPPTATLSSNGPIDEGGAATVSFSNQFDPGAYDTAQGFHYAFDCTGATGAASSMPSTYAGAGTTPSTTCPFNDEGTYTISARIFDASGGGPGVGYSEYTTQVTVNDVAPQVSISSPSYDQLIQVAMAGGTAPVNVTAPFTDAGTADSHGCTVQWDASLSPVAGSVTETIGSGSGTCSASNNLSPGVYLITVNVQESDNPGGPIGTATTEIVVYDPTSGFVTGGGWINSPAGAMPANPSLTGKANFGFVSKYQKGASVPTGETEFQFQVGNLDFHSGTYTVLTISGNQAQYRGSGTINGANDSSGNPYKFILTAKDGNMQGWKGTITPDGFRMKITDSSGTVIYDNLLGATDDLGNTQTIAGGSIVIHS